MYQNLKVPRLVFIFINIDELSIISHGILGLFITAIFIPLYTILLFLSENTNSLKFHNIVLSSIFPKPPIEIRTTYPDQWVALTDVEYMDDDGINVESAVVVNII